MGRGLWFVAGAGTGVYAVVRARRVAEAFTPEGLADRLGALGLGVRLLAADVREAATERETALRDELGLQLRVAEQPGSPALEARRGTTAHGADLALVGPAADDRAC